MTDSTGTLNKPIEAGDQLTVGAPSDKLFCDDEEAIIRRSNFKQALAALGLLGGGDKLPMGYTRVEFLESTGTQRIVDESVTVNQASSWKVKTKKNTTKTPAAVFSATKNSNNRFGVIAVNGAWRFDYAKLMQATSIIKQADVYVLEFTENLQCLVNGKVVHVFKSADFLSENSFALFNNKIEEHGYDGRVYYMNLSSVTGKRAYVPALDPTGAPCMYDTVTGQPFRNSGTGQFIAGIKDAAQLRTVLRKLPDLTGQDIGTLTLSIPAEANTPEMQALLDTTEAQKNWELTIQERASEVATYSLRRVRKVVWVRRVQSEHGGYVDADGERWQTEWCSAIYSPLGNDPTLHGYEPFDRVEQAAEQWGLVPYVDPNAEDELLTEYENHGQE